MKLLWVTYFILNINAAIDTGKYQDISVAEVEDHIDGGDLISYLRERLEGDLDLTFIKEPDALELNAKLNDILVAQRGNERRKWGIENSGLCLLVAWANEIMQREAGQQVA